MSKTLLAEPFGQRLLGIFTVLSPFYVKQPHDKGSALYNSQQFVAKIISKDQQTLMKNNQVSNNFIKLHNFSFSNNRYLYPNYLKMRVSRRLRKPCSRRLFLLMVIQENADGTGSTLLDIAGANILSILSRTAILSSNALPKDVYNYS
jgi:hypothetical protein